MHRTVPWNSVRLRGERWVLTPYGTVQLAACFSSGIPLNVLSRWLRHASLQPTLIYLEILPDPLGEMGGVT